MQALEENAELLHSRSDTAYQVCEPQSALTPSSLQDVCTCILVRAYTPHPAQGCSKSPRFPCFPTNRLAELALLHPGPCKLLPTLCTVPPALCCSFLATRTAKTVLRSTSQFFPSVTLVTLVHAGGWCDPMQARMDVEPVVCQERRTVSLEPLAAAFTQVSGSHCRAGRQESQQRDTHPACMPLLY